MADATIQLSGMREFLAATDRARKQIKKESRKALGDIAAPIARDAEDLARMEIRRIGVKWPLMRVGVTLSLVYVAPKQRGRLSRKNPKMRRPNLAPLLMDKAMAPALAKNAGLAEQGLENMLAVIGSDWER